MHAVRLEMIISSSFWLWGIAELQSLGSSRTSFLYGNLSWLVSDPPIAHCRKTKAEGTRPTALFLERLRSLMLSRQCAAQL